MPSAAQLAAPLARARARARFARWVARSRLALARANCDLEVVAPHGALFGTPPIVEPTLQRLGEGVERTRRGKVRIELGEWTWLGRGLTIEVLPSADSTLRIGDGVTFGSTSRLILFGGEIAIGPWSRVRDVVSLKSSGALRCGEQTILQSMTMLHCARELIVEDRVTFGERVSVLDSDHLADGSDVHTQAQPLAIDPVRIGANAWIAANAVVLRGARLGANTVVAAGSVVREGDYPAGWLVAGAPASARKALPGAPVSSS